jgi:hypothetical protein
VTRAAALALVLAAAVSTASAEPLRLRGDALAGTPSPVGLLVLDGEGDVGDWLSAEGLVWLGAGAGTGDRMDPSSDTTGDALVIALRARGAGGRAEGRLGRFVVATGALRPLHLDGAAGRVRLPRRIDIEAFAGMPVAADGVERTWDWAAGGRVARRIGDWGGTGLAFLERRDAGRLAVRELGLDAGLALGRNDVSAKLALDLIDGGTPAPALAEWSAATRRGALRGELVATYRSPSHLVPATSLFSVLGDVPSTYGGGRATWRAAPRLDLAADAGVRVIDGDGAEQITGRATLRLDDRGRGAITGELRRSGGDGMDGAWTGARLATRVPLLSTWTLSSELELVVPDEGGDRGDVWPWAMVAASWTRGAWDAAVAVEASATAQERRRVDALCRIGRRWEGL